MERSLVADPTVTEQSNLSEAVEQAILGGSTMVQLRDKDASPLDFYRMAEMVKAVTDRH